MCGYQVCVPLPVFDVGECLPHEDIERTRFLRNTKEAVHARRDFR